MMDIEDVIFVEGLPGAPGLFLHFTAAGIRYERGPITPLPPAPPLRFPPSTWLLAAA